MFPIPYTLIKLQVQTALAEDIGNGDLTASLIPESALATAHLVSREDGILCGQAWFEEVFRQLDLSITIEWYINDGQPFVKDSRICTLSGPAAALLTGERTAMNFLQTLSGTATQTSILVKQLEGTSIKLLDTRKTIPGLREAQKYAVRCGGGYNHRHGLFDGVLIKENHIAAAGSITRAVETARTQIPHTLKVEVETETLAEVKEALNAGADILLLDNMTLEQIHSASALNTEITHGQARLEVSGNITADSLEQLKQTAIDYISVGAITKHVRAIDFSMRFES